MIIYQIQSSLEKKALYLSVNVFRMKVPIDDTIFTSPNGDGTAILRGHSSHWKVKPLVPSFLSYFRTLSNGLAPGIKPTTYRSAVKRSTN